MTKMEFSEKINRLVDRFGCINGELICIADDIEDLRDELDRTGKINSYDRLEIASNILNKILNRLIDNEIVHELNGAVIEYRE